MTCNITSEFSY